MSCVDEIECIGHKNKQTNQQKLHTFKNLYTRIMNGSKKKKPTTTTVKNKEKQNKQQKRVFSFFFSFCYISFTKVKNKFLRFLDFDSLLFSPTFPICKNKPKTNVQTHCFFI
jgi:hypothetical protein